MQETAGNCRKWRGLVGVTTIEKHDPELRLVQKKLGLHVTALVISMDSASMVWTSRKPPSLERPMQTPLPRHLNSGQCFGNPNPYNLPKKYGSTPPICTAVRPSFVSPYFPGF